MKKFLAAICAASLLISGCGGGNTAEKPAPAPVQQAAPIEEKSSSQWANLPKKISILPSIGATRAEFERYHTKTNENSIANIRYDNDVWIVQFFDEAGNQSASKDTRAFSVIVQVVKGKDFPKIQLPDLLPSDAQNLQYDNIGSDNMVTVQNVKGTSQELYKIYPESDGQFGGNFNWDKETGNFIGGTIMVILLPPSARK